MSSQQLAFRQETGPVYTVENECQDCYKCLRHCHCKAISIIDGKASVIREACVACGQCVKVCPAHAKRIRSGLGRLRQLLTSGEPVYASIAPSWVGYFPGVTIGELSEALHRLGFAGASETAHGAQAVSAYTAEYLRTGHRPLVISSACPACVDYIRKYHPAFTGSIMPFTSPVQAHCRLLKKQYGENIRVVFFGPCAAKKNEADRNPELLTLALTFAELDEMLADDHVVFDGSTAPLALGAAREGRFYAIEGGMNDTLRDGGRQVRYVSVSGLDNLARMLGTWHDDGASPGGRTIFIEALACSGGCVNGPAMPQTGPTLDTIQRTDADAPLEASRLGAAEQNTGIGSTWSAEELPLEEPTEEELKGALARVGKFGKSDELNCGACGYNTCRDFARALFQNKAEEAMCHTFLRKNSQRTSNALIKYIPAAVVIVDENHEITECNRNFAQMAGMTDVFDTLGNLTTVSISSCMPQLEELFSSVIANGGEIEEYNQKVNDRIVNLSVFSIALGKYAGAVVQDVTRSELHREQIAEKAREVIRKNVITVQQVARLFGEHVAETEIMLNEIAGSYEVHSRGEDSDGK